MDNGGDISSRTSTFITILQLVKLATDAITFNVRQQIIICYEYRNDLKFDMHKIGYLDFQMKEESTHSD